VSAVNGVPQDDNLVILMLGWVYLIFPMACGMYLLGDMGLQKETLLGEKISFKSVL